jgi:5-methylcytosine-specific restriction protein A
VAYQVLGEDGAPLDAHLDIEGREFVFHSRGGKKGQSGARNMEYGPGLRLLFRRLVAAGLRIDGAWLDSEEVSQLELGVRSILDGSDLAGAPEEWFRIMSTRMQDYGRPVGAPRGGSRVKKVRIRVTEADPSTDLVDVLGIRWVDDGPRQRKRLPVKAFDAVTAENIWNAVQRLSVNPHDHPFGTARKFDLVADDDLRLPPEAVFGLAASEALGFELLPEHFPGGVFNRSHRALEAAGYAVVDRGAVRQSRKLPLTDEDREWSEGRPKLIVHLTRERAAGLSRAKKQNFVRQHGRLLCERCGLDPVEAFGSEVGEACIDVHHKQTQIGQMREGQRTVLDDLQCLCANCHRIVHALLRCASEDLGEEQANATPDAGETP